MVVSFKAAYDSYFVPNGFASFAPHYHDYVAVNNNKYINELLYKKAIDRGHGERKIMSGTGQIFFELGFIGILYVYIFFILAFKYYKSIRQAFFLTFTVFLLMATAVPITMPHFGFLYGLFVYKVYKERNHSHQNVHRHPLIKRQDGLEPV